MSWSEIKKALNTDLSVPLNTLITNGINTLTSKLTTLQTTANNANTNAQNAYNIVNNSEYGNSALYNKNKRVYVETGIGGDVISSVNLRNTANKDYYVGEVLSVAGSGYFLPISLYFYANRTSSYVYIIIDNYIHSVMDTHNSQAFYYNRIVSPIKYNADYDTLVSLIPTSDGSMTSNEKRYTNYEDYIAETPPVYFNESFKIVASHIYYGNNYYITLYRVSYKLV
jgi:hypothetical protein